MTSLRARREERRGQAWRESVVVTMLLAALAVVMTWPAAAFLGSAVRDVGDPALTTWILAWDIHALTTAPLRLFDANMFHPHRWTLAYTEHLLGLAPLAGVARLAGADPLLAHNLVWLATFPLVGLTLFCLVRHLTGHAGAATVAAVLYAFSHFRFGQLSHIQILSHQWLPLMLLGLHRAARPGNRWRDLGLAGGAFALQALSSGYQAFFAAMAGLLFVAWLALPSARPPLRRLLVRGAAVVVLLALLLLPFALPYRFVRDEVELSRRVEEVVAYAARPHAYLAAPGASRWLGEVTARFRVEEAALAPGVVVVALATVGAVLAWRRPVPVAPPEPAPRRRWVDAIDLALAAAALVALANWLVLGHLAIRAGPIDLSRRELGWLLIAGIGAALAGRRLLKGCTTPVHGLGWLRRLGWPNAAGYYLGLTVLGVLASFGPWLALGPALQLRPVYYQLYGVVPGFDVLRVPARFGVLVTTGLSVLAGFAAADLARRVPRRGRRALALGALGAAALLEVWVAPLRLASLSPGAEPAGPWLAASAARRRSSCCRCGRSGPATWKAFGSWNRRRTGARSSTGTPGSSLPATRPTSRC
jgi:hypothetical protein